MKVQYREGIASHSGPESCGCGRKGVLEALTGERVGRVLSHENLAPRRPLGDVVFRGASAVTSGEGQHRVQRYREVHPGSAWSETPSAHGSFSRGNREIPCLAWADDVEVRAVNPKGARRR